MTGRERINHPAHYGGDTVYEAIKVIEAWDLDFNLGNAVKYIRRAGHKAGTSEIEDLEKALWYLRRALDNKRAAMPSRPQHAGVRDEDIGDDGALALADTIGDHRTAFARKVIEDVVQTNPVLTTGAQVRQFKEALEHFVSSGWDEMWGDIIEQVEGNLR